MSLAALLLFAAETAHSASDLDLAASELKRVTREIESSRPMGSKAALPPSAAQRLAAAELMSRTGDYARAIDELNQVLELQRQKAVGQNLYVDALFLLGEAYFADQQPLAARRHFAAILQGTPSSPFMPYAGRAAARLVDIAVALQDIGALHSTLDSLQQLPVDANGSIEYARSKLHVARGESMPARVAASHIPASSKYYPQAQYLLGVIELQVAAELAGTLGEKPAVAGVLPERYLKAVAQFQRVTQLKVETPEHRRVIDEAWLALGRIFYETANYLDAAQAYNRIRSGSPQYSAMLNELSWVYVRLGDYENALPLLETLELTEGDTLQRIDGALLRGDVLLRSGEDEAALQAYRRVRDRNEPLRAEVASYLARYPEPSMHYDQLLVDRSTLATSSPLSSVLLAWVGEIAREQPALAIAEDDADCRVLLLRSSDLVRKLKGALLSRSRVRLFPKQRAELVHWESLSNRLARVRLLLAQNIDAMGGATGGHSLTEERRELMPVISRLPKNQEDFERREREGQWQWSGVSRELHHATLDANRLQALVNGLLRVLEERIAMGRASDPAVARLQSEVQDHQRVLGGYQQRIVELQRAVDLGRVQIGLGDQRFVNDRRNRERFAELLTSEVHRLVQAGNSPAVAQALVRMQGVLGQVTVAEQQVVAARARLDAEIRSKVRELDREVVAESKRLDDYQRTLGALEQEARGLLGAAAKQAFVTLEGRLTDLVRRSDAAVATQAWEARERAQKRLIDLQHARGVEQAQIDQDLQEILGEGRASP